MKSTLSALILGGVLLVSSAFAGAVERCQETQLDSRDDMYVMRTPGYSRTVTLTTAGIAVSVTMPATSSTLQVRFSNSMDYYSCFDATSPNNWCGTSKAANDSGTNAWLFKPAKYRLGTASNTVPTVMWVSGVTSGTLPYTVCKEGN